MKKNNILVPYDFTELSNNGLRSAIALARKNGNQISLLHIIDENRPEGFHPTADMTARGKLINEHDHFVKLLTQKRIRQFEDIRKEHKDIDISSHIEFGTFSDGMTNYLNDHEIDLIIIGHREKHPYQNFIREVIPPG